MDDKKICYHHAGRVLVISLDEETLPEVFTEIRMANTLVSKRAYEAVAAFLVETRLDEVAGYFGITRSRAQRLRKSFGLTKPGVKPGEGTSRSTRWRQSRKFQNQSQL